MSSLRLPGILLSVAFVFAGCGGADAEERAPAPTPIVRDAREAADWIAEALSSSGYRADFSPASARELDRFFDDQMKGPGRPKPGGLLEEDLGPRLFAVGAYIGEVIRRNSEGWAWAPAKGDPDDEINLSLRRGDEVIWPIRRAMGRYRDGGEAAIAAYVAAVADVDVGPSRGTLP